MTEPEPLELTEHFDHLEAGACSCVTRDLVPVERTPSCPSCGAVSPFSDGFMCPTAAPLGSLKLMIAGCSCGTEYDVVVSVERAR